MSDQPPPVMSNDEFAEAMLRPMGAALSEWASAWARQPAEFGHVPAAASRVMGELAAEQQWATPGWLEPARNAHSCGQMLSYALAHLAAMATIVMHTPVGPAFSHMPSMGAVFDAFTSRALAAGSTHRRRAAHQAQHHLQAQVSQRRRPDDSHPGAVSESVRIRDACKAFAKHHHWSTAKDAIGGDELPMAKNTYSAVALGKPNKKLDAMTWSVVSAAHHSTWYMLAASFKHGITVKTPLDPLGGIGPIVVEGDDLATFLGWPGKGAWPLLWRVTC